MKTICVPHSSHILTCHPAGGLSQSEAPHLTTTPTKSFLHKELRRILLHARWDHVTSLCKRP